MSNKKLAARRAKNPQKGESGFNLLEVVAF